MKQQIMSDKIVCRDLPCFCFLLNSCHPIHSSDNGCDFYVGHLQAAKEARHDKEAVVKFFRKVSMVFELSFLFLIYGLSSKFCGTSPFS